MIAVTSVVGNVGHFEVKQSASGNQYVEFGLCNNRGYGESKASDWYHCVAFDKLAERMIKAGVKSGSYLQVVGEQRIEKFVSKKTNQETKDIKLVLYDFSYVQSGGKKAEPKAGADTAPTGTPAAAAPAAGGTDDFQEVDVDDDGDLPF